MTVSRGFRILAVVLVSAVSFWSGCSTAEKPKAEAPPPSVAQAEQPQQMSDLPPPELNSVQEAVKRVFNDSVVIDTSRKPSFIAGDFNGDLSQDIAVVLKPSSGKLAEMNEELPNWLLRDPFAASEPRVTQLRVAENEVLLAVIHGFGPNGWRDPQATQTYLLKNAVGSGMEAHQAKDVTAASRGKKMPQLHGDVIGEVLKSTPGYLYFASATYSWYDPKNFKGEPERGMVHVPPSERVKKID